MKWLIDSYPGFVFVLGIAVPFILWMTIGLRGRFQPWRSNVAVLRNESWLLVQQHRVQTIMPTIKWQERQMAWLRAGVFAFVFIFLITFVPLILSSI